MYIIAIILILLLPNCSIVKKNQKKDITDFSTATMVSMLCIIFSFYVTAHILHLMNSDIKRNMCLIVNKKFNFTIVGKGHLEK